MPLGELSGRQVPIRFREMLHAEGSDNTERQPQRRLVPCRQPSLQLFHQAECARGIAGLLFGIAPHDPISYAMAATVETG